MSIPSHVRRREVLAYATVPAAGRDRHSWVDLPGGAEHRVESFVLAIERGAEFHVGGDDGSERVEPDTYWVFQLDASNEVIEDDAYHSLDYAKERWSALEWIRFG